MIREIDLGNGVLALVSNRDYKNLADYSWHKASYFYAARTVTLKPWSGRVPEIIYMHRQILQPGPEEMVDHINGNGLDNRRENLRICTNAQNQANRLPLSNKLYCGFKGVSHSRRGYGWVAQITSNKQAINLGTFEAAEDAARAYDRRALELHGEFAMTNEMLGLLPPDDGSGGRRISKRSDNTSGYTGVRLHRHSGLWQARAWKGGKTVWSAYFKTSEEAHIARVEEMRMRGISPHIPVEIQ